MLIIPAIDIQGEKCVRLSQGKQGSATIYSDHPAEVGRHWASLGAERIHVVDLDGAFHGQPQNLDVVREIVKYSGVPVQVGGGIRTMESISFYMESGVDSVILGSKVVQDNKFLRDACGAYPGKIIVGIDARKGWVTIKGWTEMTNQTAIQLAQSVVDLGIAAIIYTDVDRDGMLAGPNFLEISSLARNVKVPVIASGGVSRLEDIRSLLSLESDGVTGVIIGKALYTGDVRLQDALMLAKTGDQC